jgi:hypothetical protein
MEGYFVNTEGFPVMGEQRNQGETNGAGTDNMNGFCHIKLL